nr:CD200-like protein [Betacoronavirus Erinaceus]
MNQRSICRLIFFVHVLVLCRAQVLIQNATVQLNKPASLRCTLQSSQEVLIVTWQKIKQGSPENMVTYSKNHGVVLQPSYKDKVNITQLELTNSTITFWNITQEDDGCYNCLFNTFSRKISGKSCLTIIAQPTESVAVLNETVNKALGENHDAVPLLLSIVSLIILLVLISILLYWKRHRQQEVGPEVLALSSQDVIPVK